MFEAKQHSSLNNLQPKFLIWCCSLLSRVKYFGINKNMCMKDWFSTEFLKANYYDERQYLFLETALVIEKQFFINYSKPHGFFSFFLFMFDKIPLTQQPQSKRTTHLIFIIVEKLSAQPGNCFSVLLQSEVLAL